jgi:N-acetylglucosamine malate deacetylase 1
VKLDILVFSAHPDDAELACSGTILNQVAKGNKVGIVDFTEGELGTRGSAPLRLKEAEEAGKILGLSVRRNLKLRDGFFQNEEKDLLEIIKQIRAFKPTVVFANAIEDRHPDHGRAAELAERACFLSGLVKIETELDGRPQEAWRPSFVYHYIQDRFIKPDFIVDISLQFEKKLDAIRAFKSQFYDPNDSSPNTYISSPEFMEFLRARAEEYGHAIGVKYGEGFTTYRKLGIDNIFDLK